MSRDETRSVGGGTMLSQLIESRRYRERQGKGILVSIALHALLVCALLAAAPERGDGGRMPREIEEVIIFTPPPTPEPPVPAGTRDRERLYDQPGEPLPPWPLRDVKEIPVGTPEIPEIATDIEVSLRRWQTLRESGHSGGDVAGSSIAAGEPLPVQQAERPPMVLRAARPHYPVVLRARKLEGAITARFVIDTSGMVPVSSIEMVEGDEPLFMEAVRGALVRARFRAAEVNGRRVAVLVEQRFAFTLTR